MIKDSFVTAEELEKLLREHKKRDETLFHVVTMPKNSELTEEQHKLLFIKGVIQGDYDK